MKLLSTYIKEMKIAARGFYFYIEIFMAVIIITILLVAVKENPVSKEKEFLFYDMEQEMVDTLFNDGIEEGTVKYIDPVDFDVKAQEFEVTNKETGETTAYKFEKGTITVQAIEKFEEETGELDKTLYLADTEEDMIRLSHSEKTIAAKISLDDNFEAHYEYYIQGYETERMQSLLYIIHNESLEVLEEAGEKQTVRQLGEFETLNNRENLIPPMVVLMGSMMGFFIVIAYIFLDKDEGVIRAFAVSSSAVWKYLLSKAMVIMTTVIISSTIIIIPVMGAQPNYPLFYLYLLISTFSFAALGLLIASFFNSMTKAFGALYGGMMLMMIPAFSYFIPSFDPVWIRFLPTYPLMQGFKEIISVDGDVTYVLTYSVVFLVGGIILFMVANSRFKKTLTV